MSREGILFVLSGFSGAGKGTLVQKLIEDNDRFALSISATTREPREGEIHGVHYFYVTEERFREMIDAEELYEYARYQDHFYGTPRAYVDEQLAAGKDVILEIDVQGAGNIKKRFPDTVLIFVTTPSARILHERLLGRGTESPEKVAGRMKRAAEETARMADYDYILVNDDLEEAVTTLEGIVAAEHARSFRRGDLISRITEELQEY